MADDSSALWVRQPCIAPVGRLGRRIEAHQCGQSRVTFRQTEHPITGSLSTVIRHHAFIQNLRRGHFKFRMDARRGLTLAAAFDEFVQVIWAAILTEAGPFAPEDRSMQQSRPKSSLPSTATVRPAPTATKPLGQHRDVLRQSSASELLSCIDRSSGSQCNSPERVDTAGRT